jgi:hypothetical protein
MKNRKPLPIPQHEFGFTPDTFTLFSELGVDGERITREREQSEQARRTADAAQASLFATLQPVKP